MRNKLYKLSLYCYKMGFWYGLWATITMFFGRKGQVIPIHIKGYRQPVYIRAQSSDEYTFQQIFVNKEYEFNSESTPKTLIDAGANIGLAAVYFANLFPDCKIVCLEPESENFELLQKNIAFYSNISAIKTGLWSHSTFLNIRDAGLGNWGFTVEETDQPDSNSLKALSANDVKEQFGFSTIDIMKMDIEGSEKEVFEASDVHQWLSSCHLLIIELHDRMKKGTSSALFRVLLNYETQIEQKGENMICRIRS